MSIVYITEVGGSILVPTAGLQEFAKAAGVEWADVSLKDLAYQIEIAGKSEDMTKAASLIPKLDEQFEVLKKRVALKLLAEN